MSDSKKNFYSSIIFVVFAMVVFFMSYSIPATTSDILGSRFFPRLISGMTGILGIIQAIESGIKVRKEQKYKNKLEFNLPLTLTITALLLYYFLIIQLGFIITSSLYLFCQSLILMDKQAFKDKKKLVVLGIISIILPVAINWIFWNLFNIGLPTGNLF